MKKSMLWIGKVLVPTILVLVLSIAMVPVETASTLLLVTQTDPTTTYGTLYFDPPTIDGTAIGVNNTVTVNLNIRDADEINAWQAGLYFNATALECLEFKEGQFLKKAGSTVWQPGTIDNTAGVISYHACMLRGLGNNASGDGQLASLRFKVKAPGVSDLHLSNVKVFQIGVEVPSNIIDVYTVVVDATRHTVVTVSNSTGATATYGSRFFAHSFNQILKELSFKVSGPYPGFSNVTIPKTLLNVSTLDEWKVIIDDIQVNRTVTENATHTSIYFTYSLGIHKIQIATLVLISSTISITLSSTSITLGSSVTISGAIDPLRPGVTVTILYRLNGGDWTTLTDVTTDSNSYYNYTWTPEEAGTYEIKASWGGDQYTLPAESDVLTLTVEGKPKQTMVFFNINPNPTTPGQTITLKGVLVDENTSPLGNETVKLYVRPIGGSWRYITSVTTNTYGIFMWQATIPWTVAPGTFIFVVYYPGSEMYESTYNFAILIVQ